MTSTAATFNCRNREYAMTLQERALALSETETAILIRAIASGDIEAFARFYRRWFGPMFIMARRCAGRDESFCLDVVQDSMMRVIRSIRPMNDEVAVERWLHVVVKTCALDMLRRERRRRVREQRSKARSPKLDASSSNDALELEHRIAWLRDQIARLPSEQAHLLSLRFRFGWTLSQIGRAVGLKPGAVDGRLTRALATLREQALEETHHDS